MAGTFSYTKAAMERAMKVQEVILRAMARKITGGKRRWPGAGGTIGERVYASTQPDLDLIFALQFERTVNRDHTVSIQNLRLQIEAVRWRASLAGCTVTVHQHLDGSYSLTHGPQSDCSTSQKMKTRKKNKQQINFFSSLLLA